MSTWLFFLGLQMVLFIATFIWVIVWMNRKPDALDKKLDEMNAANKAAALEKAKQSGMDIRKEVK